MNNQDYKYVSNDWKIRYELNEFCLLLYIFMNINIFMIINIFSMFHSFSKHVHLFVHCNAMY